SRRCRTATSLSRLLRRRWAWASSTVATVTPISAAANTNVEIVLFIVGLRSAEGRVLERGRQPEADADLEHDVVDERGVRVLLRLARGGVHADRTVRRLELVDEHVIADAEVDRQPLREEES